MNDRNTADQAECLRNEIRFEQGLRVLEQLYSKGKITLEQKESIIRLYADFYKPYSSEFRWLVS